MTALRTLPLRLAKSGGRRLAKRVDKRLTKATGLRIVRATAVPDAGSKRGKKTASRPGTAQASEIQSHYDDRARAIIRAVRPYTMTGNAKLYALILATRYVVKHRIPGDVVECGVWRGGSMLAAARTLIEVGDTSRDLYLFDTYEGMPPPTEKDAHAGRSAQELLDTNTRDSKVWAVATLDDVRANLGSVPYPPEKVHFVKGLVEDTVPEQAPRQIAILRLDTDWYESTRHELEHLYDRLSPGGVLIIDDYGYWRGSQEAADEWLEKTGARLLLLPAGTGRIAVKP